MSASNPLPDSEAEIKDLTDTFASQIDTLQTKYHHEEIAFDKYIEMGEFYMKQHTAAIQQMLVRARIDEVEGMAALAVDTPEVLPTLAARLDQLQALQQSSKEGEENG